MSDTAAMSEPMIGVCGLRTFRISRDMHLVPAIIKSADWAGGVATANCRSTYGVTAQGPHPAPQLECSCGIYATRSVGFLRRQYNCARDVLTVVALEGTTIEGDHGWRAAAARIVAVWIRPGLLTAAETMQLLDRLPGVRLYSGVDEMVAAFPGLSVSEPPVSRRAGLWSRMVSWRLTAVVTLLSPLLVLYGLLVGTSVLEGILRAGPSLSGYMPAVTGLGVLLAGYGYVFATRPRWRLPMTRLWVIAAVSMVAVLLWFLTIVFVQRGDGNHVGDILLLGWLVATIVLTVQRPQTGVFTANPNRSRKRTRTRWATTDLEHRSKRGHRYG